MPPALSHALKRTGAKLRMNTKIHPTSDVQSKNIGAGTSIWQFCVVLPDAQIGEVADCSKFIH